MTDQISLLIGIVVMALVPAYFVLQAMLVARYRGGWLIAALVPLAATGPALVHALIAFSQESNLWPLVLIAASPFAFLYLCGLAFVKSHCTGAAFSR